jgi:hypothetical protein
MKSTIIFPSGLVTSDTTYGPYSTYVLSDSVLSRLIVPWSVPSDFDSFTSVELIIVSVATGEARIRFGSSRFDLSMPSLVESCNGSYSNYVTGLGDSSLKYINVPIDAWSGLSAINPNDAFNFIIDRNGAHGTDTLSGDLNIVGLRVMYNITQTISTDLGLRTKKITDRILSLLGVTSNDKIPLTTIYGYMDDAQSEIAETALCIESSDSMTVTGNVATEPTGFYRMKLIELGTGTLIQPAEVSVTDYDLMTKVTFASTILRGMFFKRWGGSLKFYPTLDNGTYTCYFYKSPSTNVSAICSPETPARYDPAIEAYAVYHLAPFVGKEALVPLYKSVYESQLKDAITSQRRTKPGHYSIQYHDV